MALTNFEEKLNKAKEPFGDFHTKRKLWDSYLRREEPTVLAPELLSIQEGIDYRTPDLEKATFDWIDSLTTNPTIFDLSPVSEDEKAKETGRDILMWLHRGWELENPGRSWDRAAGQGQVRHGLKVMQQTYKPPKEPKLEEGLSPDEYAKKRDKAMRNRPYPFGWRDCDIYGCFWLGDETREEGADFFAYEVEIPFIEAKETYRKSGHVLACDGGKVAWVGQDQEVGTSANSQTVRVVTIDARDLESDCDLEGCEHANRKICIYVCGEGQGPTEDTLYEEYDSPFPGCSFHVIPGRMTTERNPDARFRPTILPLYVEAQWVNNLTTQLAAMARKDYGPNNLYIDGANADPRHVSEAVKDGLVDFKMGEEGSLPWVPGDIKRLPNNISPHIITLIDMHQQRMLSYMPNRYLTGNADTQASNATGTAFLQQATQAQLPANTLLAASDYIILRSRRYVIHAIKKWGQNDPDGQPTRYYAVMSGNNSGVMVKGKQPRAGEIFYVTADSINLDFDLNVITKSQSLAEQAEQWRLGKDMFISGVLTPEQLIRAAGIDDVEGQKEDLRAAGIRADFYQDEKIIRRAYLLRRISSRTGVDVASLGAPPATGGQPAASGGLGGTTHIGPTLNQQQQSQQRSTEAVALTAGLGTPGPEGGAGSMN